MFTPVVKVKYLTNKDLLEEIHQSKLSYCSFVDQQYAKYDAIVGDVNQITEELIESLRIKRATLLIKRRRKEDQTKKSKMMTAEDENEELLAVLEEIPKDSIVIRVMTQIHIPMDENKKAKIKPPNNGHIKCNFPPFMHFIMQDSVLVCVLKSHWKGGMENGHFCKDHGGITDNLARMYIKLVNKYSQRGNLRNYTYLEEMRSQALLQLSHVGLQFDESRSEIPNPFAYYTQTIKNSFMRILSIEKKNQNIRDDLLIMHGASPSYTRMVDHEISQQNQSKD